MREVSRWRQFMKSLFRFLLNLFIMLVMLLAMMVLTGCSGSYGCRVTFGNSTCTPSGTGFGGGGGGGGRGGGGGGTVDAFVYDVDLAGTMDGYALSTSAATFGSISGYTAPAIPTNDPGVGMVVAQSKFLYTVFQIDGEIAGWSIDPTSGSLTPLTGFPQLITLDVPVFGFNIYNVAVNPAGTLLFIADTGSNLIYVYQIDSTSGALTLATGAPYAVSAPGNLGTDGLGRFLYVCQNAASHTGSQVTAFSIGSTGALTAVTGSPFSLPMWQVQGDGSGQFLFGTTGNAVVTSGVDDKHLYVFTIQQTGTNAGAITAVSGSPFATTYSPFNIATQPA